MVQLALCNFLRFRIYSFIELFYTENVNSCAYIHIVITAFEHRKQLASPEKCLCVCVCVYRTFGKKQTPIHLLNN